MWASAGSLRWLEIILKERFGHIFSLQVKNQNLLVMSVPGEGAEIEFDLELTAFTRNDSDLPCVSWKGGLEGWEGESELPMPGVNDVIFPLIRNTTQGYRISYDILGFTYWMLTRQEEVGRKDLDKHNRFPAVASHAYRYNYLERPIVDEWLAVLAQVVKKTWPQLILKNHEFEIKVSHDVDTPSQYGFKTWPEIFRIMAGHLIKRRDLRAFVMTPFLKLRTRRRLLEKDLFNTFDWIMTQSEAKGYKSAFYFICGRTDVLKDADYDLEHPAIRDLLRRIHGRGHEIGIHPSYRTYQKTSAISAEVQNLRRTCEKEHITQLKWGGRMHYLRWEQPTTLLAWEAAGMDYDSTLGYADRPGFRCGTCFEYPAFDFIANKILNIRIRPLIVMEGTVIDSAYLGLGASTLASDKIESLKESCKKVGGCFTLLWHNSYLTSKALRDLYLKSIGFNKGNETC